MSITRINTNTDALMAGANLRKLEFSMSRTMSHLSSGLRIVTGSDDPSGVALMGKFQAQLGGARTAIQNAEDGLSLMQLADTSMGQAMDILLRMRDIAVRAANEATMTTAERANLQQELGDLKTEITRRRAAVTFNTKILFSGALSGATLQIGPDNAATQALSIRIPLMSITDIAGRDITDACLTTVTAALSAIDLVQSAISGLATLQSIVGVQERALERTINDLSSLEVNMAAAASRITDADMALEVSEFARQQVLAQSATAMIAQANAQPQSVLKLLGI